MHSNTYTLPPLHQPFTHHLLHACAEGRAVVVEKGLVDTVAGRDGVSARLALRALVLFGTLHALREILQRDCFQVPPCENKVCV